MLIYCHFINTINAGVLLYFSDGLLPLITAYYKDFFAPPKVADIRERQMTTSAKIVKALLVNWGISFYTCNPHCVPHTLQDMSEVLVEHLTQDAQVKLYRGTVLTILKKCGEELPLDVDRRVKCMLALGQKESSTMFVYLYYRC